jgi:ubiquinone biosynthesis protein Coq4
MKLSEITSKPKLIEVILDDEDIIKEYNEAITFYTWDRQPMDVFMKLANTTSQDTSNLINIVRTLILDEKGKEIIKEDAMLPTSVLMKAIAKVTELLGK